MVARRSIVSSPVSWFVAAFLISLVVPFGPRAGLARAGTQSYEPHQVHQAAARPEVTLTDRAKPPPRRDAAPAPPTADDLLAVEALLGEVHLEQAGVLRSLIKQTPDAEAHEKADYYVRLAELAARTQRTHRLQGAEAEIALAKATDPRRRAELAASAASHKAAADAAVIEIIDVYRTVLGNPGFASYPHLDTAVFYYAYTLAHADHRDEARGAYERLIKSYPASRFIADAYFALGDDLFEAGRLAEAEARYRKVLQLSGSAGSALVPYAQYKLGWVVLSQRRYQDALELFYQVAQTTAQRTDLQPLHHAALHDLVRAYAEIGRPDRATPMFRRVDPKDPFTMLASLGDLYLDQGKFEHAIVVFRELLHTRPGDPKVCTWQHAIARATLAIGTPADRIHEIEELVRLYVALRDRKALPAGDLAECRDVAAEMSGQLARAYHQEAVKTQNLAIFGFADRLYRAYLGAFRGADSYAETEYFHAELGWAGAELEHTPQLAARRWEEVATAFTQVVETGQVSPKLIQVSADASVQAWMKALAVEARPEPRPDPTGAATGAAAAGTAAASTPPVPRPLPPAQRKMLAAYELYLAHVPDAHDDERVGVLFLKANLLRQFDHLAEAIPLFEAIVAQHPAHETAEYAAQLVLDSDNRLGREPAMLAFADGLSPAFLAAHPAVGDVVVKLRHTALRKQAEALEAEGRRTGRLEPYTQCGERYLAIYNLATDAADASELLYNAGVCFELGKTLGGAIRMYETLQKLFPAAAVTARALARLGNVYATTAQYREAAERLEAYAGKYAGEADAGGALSDAVQLRKGLGDDPQAIADTEKFVARFGASRTAEAAGAYFSLGAIYENQGDLDRVARHLRGYLDRYGAAGGAGRRVIAWAKLGDALWRQACPVATVDGRGPPTGSAAEWRRGSIDGVCARVVRTPPGRASAIPTRCGDDSRVELRVIERDARKVRAAAAAFDHAIAEYEHAGTQPEALGSDARGALYHYALARFDRGERDYEAYLAMPLPAALDFDRRKPSIAARSHQRFDTWWAGKTALGVRLRDAYQPITALGDGAMAIAAATRIAAISQNAAAQLYRAEIPANLRVGPYAEDASQAYCEALEQVAEPLEAAALTYYQACLTTSTRLGWFSAWSRICERELGHLQPAQFPSTLELRREPSAVAVITTLEPAMRAAP